MSDENNTANTNTTQDPAQVAAPVTQPPAPAPVQMALGMSAEQLTEHTDAVRRAAEAEARLKAEHEKSAAIDAAKR